MNQHFSDKSNEKVIVAIEELREDLKAAAAEDLIHSTYEELQGYVDGTLDEADRENVESHLEICADCSASERDLRTLQQDLKAASGRPQAIPFSRTLWWKVAAVAAALIFVSSLAMLSMRSRVTGLEAQIRTLELEKAMLESQSHKSGSPAVESRGLAPEHEKIIAEVVAGKELPLPAFLAELNGAHGQLLGSSKPEEFSLASPVGTGVESDTPILRWSPWSGADSYVVSVFDSQFELVAKSETLTVTQWKVTHPLQRGRIYAWQVVASRKGEEAKSPMPPAPPAMFQVLDAKDAAEISALQQQINSPLQRGILYAHYGVLDDAQEQLRQVSASDPSSAVAARLLQQIESLRHPQ